MKKCTKQTAVCSYFWDTAVVLAAIEQIKHYGCCHGGKCIGCCNAYPYTVCSPNVWEEDEEWHKEYKLSAYAEEDALLCHTDRLEEVACHNLETNDWAHADDESHTIDCKFCEYWVVCEELHRIAWEELTECERAAHDDCGKYDGFLQYFVYTVKLLCSVIETCNWLHSLANTKHNHNEEECDTVDNAVCCNGYVASMSRESLVDKDYDKASAELHTEWGKSDSEDVLDDILSESVDATMKMQQVAFIAQLIRNKDERNNLCEYCGYGCTTNAKSEGENEYWVENGIDYNGCNGCHHCCVRMTRRTKCGIETKIEVSNDIAQKDNEHVLMGILVGLFAGSEEGEQWMDECNAYDA